MWLCDWPTHGSVWWGGRGRGRGVQGDGGRQKQRTAPRGDAPATTTAGGGAAPAAAVGRGRMPAAGVPAHAARCMCLACRMVLWAHGRQKGCPGCLGVPPQTRCPGDGRWAGAHRGDRLRLRRRTGERLRLAGRRAAGGEARRPAGDPERDRRCVGRGGEGVGLCGLRSGGQRSTKLRQRPLSALARTLGAGRSSRSRRSRPAGERSPRSDIARLGVYVLRWRFAAARASVAIGTPMAQR